MTMLRLHDTITYRTKREQVLDALTTTRLHCNRLEAAQYHATLP